jgi:hypothetical protein
MHDGICGAHQSTHKMKWLLRRAGFYWPTMGDDCIKYQKGCKVCQWFGNIQLAPTGVMNSIVKLWPFRGWGLDFIGEIHKMTHKMKLNGDSSQAGGMANALLNAAAHKLCFPKYDGTEDPLPWLNHCEQFFRETQSPDDEKVLLSAFYMQGVTQQWYYRLECI